jgi:hypothetical protein
MKLHSMIGIAVMGVAMALPVAAVPVVYYARLTGAAESPANASPATGSAVVTVDSAANTMLVHVDFAGLTAPNTASHIHCCTGSPGVATAGVATSTPTFTGFPTGVTSGTYDHLFDMTLASSYNPAFVTAQGSIPNAEAALFAGMATGRAYLNIHTGNFPGGEIRGFLAVPEPQSLALMLARQAARSDHRD